MSELTPNARKFAGRLLAAFDARVQSGHPRCG